MRSLQSLDELISRQAGEFVGMGKMPNPTLATLHKWAEALGQKLNVD